MNSEIIKNEVFIRGMLVGRYQHDTNTTAVICSRAENKEHPNYQYVTFFGEQKAIVDGMKISDKVIVTAYAWIFRDQETGHVNGDNLRLRGVSIELARDFSKRVFASIGIPIYGIKMLDCVRFSFYGTIKAINETKNHKVSMLLAVPDGERDGFNIIPLLYTGRGNEDDINNVLKNYKKGQMVSVRGFVSQKRVPINPDDENGPKQYKNTYFVTTFLRDELGLDVEDENCPDKE